MTSVALQPEGAQTARLFDTYSEGLLAYCSRRLGSRSDAEDAVQTTFLYAHKALLRGVVPESERAWLFTIAKNVCRWRARTEARRPLAVDLALDRVAAAEPRATGLGGGLDEALGHIPERQRQAIVLREWRGLSCPEIASALELSEPATHALLTRARKSLAAALENVLGRPVLGVDLGSLLLQLRAYLTGATVKAAATAVAVATVTVTGVTAQRDLARKPAQREVRVAHPRPRTSSIPAPIVRLHAAIPRRVTPRAAPPARRPSRTTFRHASGGSTAPAVRVPRADGPPRVEQPEAPPRPTRAPEPEPSPAPQPTPALVPAAPTLPDPETVVDSAGTPPLPAAPPPATVPDTTSVVSTASSTAGDVTNLLP